jgi:hypothetical protein
VTTHPYNSDYITRWGDVNQDGIVEQWTWSPSTMFVSWMNVYNAFECYDNCSYDGDAYHRIRILTTSNALGVGVTVYWDGTVDYYAMTRHSETNIPYYGTFVKEGYYYTCGADGVIQSITECGY